MACIATSLFAFRESGPHFLPAGNGFRALATVVALNRGAGVFSIPMAWIIHYIKEIANQQNGRGS